MYELYSFVYHHQTPKRASHWFLTCPPECSDRMIKYLRHHKCKFNHEEDQAWHLYVGEDRDIFTIECAPNNVVQSLIKATRDKNGLVVEPQVEVDVCVRYESNRNILKIKISGDNLRDIPCLDEQLVCKISPILKSGLKLYYYPQEQEQGSDNVTRVLKRLGFYESDGCLRCDF